MVSPMYSAIIAQRQRSCDSSNRLKLRRYLLAMYNLLSACSFRDALLLACLGLAACRSYQLIAAYLDKESAPPEDDGIVVSVYSHKYATEFRALKETPIDGRLEDLMERTVKDAGPDGVIEMALNNGEEGSFKYWSRTKEIPFSHLETVARFFCITNDCKLMCVDTPWELQEALKKQKAKMDEVPGDGEKKESEVNSGVFATLKSYRQGENTGKKQSIVPGRSNQFKYMGAKVEEETSGVTEQETCSYSAWRSTAPQANDEEPGSPGSRVATAAELLARKKELDQAWGGDDDDYGPASTVLSEEAAEKGEQ